MISSVFALLEPREEVEPGSRRRGSLIRFILTCFLVNFNVRGHVRQLTSTLFRIRFNLVNWFCFHLVQSVPSSSHPSPCRWMWAGIHTLCNIITNNTDCNSPCLYDNPGEEGSAFPWKWTWGGISWHMVHAAQNPSEAVHTPPATSLPFPPCY